MRGKTDDPSSAAVLVGQLFGWQNEDERELQNAIERAVVVAHGRTIRPNDFPTRIRAGGAVRKKGPLVPAATETDPAPSGPDAHSDRRGAHTLDEMERDAIVAALARHDGNISRVVRELGIGRTTLYRKLKRYNIK